MVKNLSAVKRDQTSLRNNLHNRSYKSSIKTLLKNLLQKVDKNEGTDNKDRTILLSAVYSKIDKAVKKGVISKNSGARKKSSISKQLKRVKINV